MATQVLLPTLLDRLTSIALLVNLDISGEFCYRENLIIPRISIRKGVQLIP